MANKFNKKVLPIDCQYFVGVNGCWGVGPAIYRIKEFHRVGGGLGVVMRPFALSVVLFEQGSFF